MMIVREQQDRYVLIRQHDHAWISGDFADHLKVMPPPSTRIGIRYHDVGWERLDDEVKWNPETGQPYSFVDFPIKEKIPAYTAGVDEVEAMDAFAACLCSMHYVSFFSGRRDAESLRFIKDEQERQRRLMDEMDREKRSRLEEDLRLLKLCDDLSLFICLNEPGVNHHPWYREGFRYGDRHLRPVWEAPDKLRIEPTPFRTSFEVTVPYRLVDRTGCSVAEGRQQIRIGR